MSRNQKLRLISAYNYYKTMVEFYGLQHNKTRAALVTLIGCYRAGAAIKSGSSFTLIKGLESEFGDSTLSWEDL